MLLPWCVLSDVEKGCIGFIFKGRAVHGPHPTIPNISISVIFNDALSSYDYVTWVINEWVWSNGGNMLKREKYYF
jgi:hypothetical protein